MCRTAFDHSISLRVLNKFCNSKHKIYDILYTSMRQWNVTNGIEEVKYHRNISFKWNFCIRTSIVWSMNGIGNPSKMANTRWKRFEHRFRSLAKLFVMGILRDSTIEAIDRVIMIPPPSSSSANNSEWSLQLIQMQIQPNYCNLLALCEDHIRIYNRNIQTTPKESERSKSLLSRSLLYLYNFIWIYIIQRVFFDSNCKQMHNEKVI